MYEIPEVKDVKLFLEKKKFFCKFIQQLETCNNQNKNIIQFDFENYVFKDEIIHELFNKGYRVQHMKFKQMYAIYFAI